MRYVDPSGESFVDAFWGRQSWSDYKIEIGQGAMNMSPMWQTAMDHPYLTGISVGLGSGAVFAGGSTALTSLSVNYLGGLGTSCLIGCNSVVQNAPKYAQQGYDSFNSFKQSVGSADSTGQNLRQWHHLVEQNPSNIARFGQQSIQSGKNMVNIPTAVHQQISGYYSSIKSFTGGQTVRNWISSQSFEDQSQFGTDVLNKVISNTLK